MKLQFKSLAVAAVALFATMFTMQTAVAQTPMTEESLMKNIKTPQGQTITLLEYKTLFNNYAKVQINEKALDLESNPVDKSMMKVKMKYKLPDVNAYLLSLLVSKTPQLKGKAIEKLTLSPTTTPKILNSLSAETNLFVIKTGIKALKDEVGNDEKIAKFVLKYAENENIQIRLAVAEAICQKSALSVPGVVDAIRMLMTDPENRVRSTIIARIGDLGDDTFVGDLSQILNDVNQTYCHKASLESLYKLWYNSNGKCSEAAYNVTIDYLTQKPRTKQIPVADAFSGTFFSTLSSSDYYVEQYNKWKDKNDFYSESKWIEIMTDLATDSNAHERVRISAAKQVATIGTKENLQNIKAKVQSMADDGDRDEIVAEIEKLLNK